MKSAKVLIVGGGIAGLTSAIALRQRGFDVEVVEQDPSWSVYGVGIIQQANVVRAVAALGILDDYLSAAFGFEKVAMFAPNGMKVAEIPSPRLAGENYPANLGISRRALHDVLGSRAKGAGAKIRLGVTFKSLNDNGKTVDVEFTDGSKSSYDFVIGADGMYSAVRAAIMPDAPKPVFTGQAVWRYNLPRTPDVDSLQAYTGPVGVGLVPLSQDLMYIYVTTPEPAKQRLPRQGLAGVMRERLKGQPEKIAALATQIVNDDEVVYRPLEAVFLEGDWHKGRIVLIGDAVHATTPHLGQGGGMAIEDSLVLAEELERAATPEEAFRAMRARRYDRCKFIVEKSVEVGDSQLGKIAQVDYPAVARQMFEVTAAPL